MAEIIKRKLGCDLTEIVPVKAYTGVYQKLVDAINVGWIGSTFKDIGESMVDVADGWRERTCEYPGRSVWNALKGVTIVARRC